MEPDRGDLSAAQAPGLDPAASRAAGPDLTGLRDAWRTRSLASGWLADDDWHSEAVDAVIIAAYRAEAGANAEAGVDAEAGADAEGDAGADTGAGAGVLASACTDLGRLRATAGIGITETIDDLAALFAVLHNAAAQPAAAVRAPASAAQPAAPGEPGQPHGGPPLHLVCCLAEGWTEENLAQLARDGCEDPLSGLATVPYLRTRLAEVYREGAESGTSPAETHRLLVIGFPRRPDPWHRMALAIVVGHDLRATFPGGETLSLARRNGLGPAIALVRAHADLPMRYARLRRSIQATLGGQIRMTRLPRMLAEAHHLVDDCLLGEQAR